MLVTEKARDVQSALRALHPETFGGMYVEHTPSFKVNVLFTDVPRQRLADVTTDPAFIALKTDRSFSELEAIQSVIGEELGARHVEYMTRIDLADSSVHVYVRPVAENARIASAFSASMPYVKFHETSGFIDPVALAPRTVPGSLKAVAANGEYCTTGFGVKHGERWGFSTAGHCENDLTLRSSPRHKLKFEAEMNQGSVDLQWHSIPDDSKYTYRSASRLDTGSRSIIIRAVRPRANMLLGDVVCKYGYTTYETCGTIQDLNFKSNYRGAEGSFVRVRRDNARTMTDSGDSGGPVYAHTPLAGKGHNTAVGLVHGRGTAGTEYRDDMFFMPTDHFSSLGLKIVTPADED